MTYLIYGKSNKVSRENNRGASLLMTIILIGIILVFAFSLLLVSYTLYASQSKKAASLRCSEAANTLSVALENELTDADAYKNSSLWKYLRCNIMNDYETWPYYDPNAASGHGEEEAFRYFDLYANTNYPVVDGFPGNLTLCIYWTPSQKALDSVSSTYSILEMTLEERKDATLYIQIIAEAGNQSYTITNTYKLNIYRFDFNETDDTNKSKAIKNITTQQYKSEKSTGYIYNPFKFKTTTNETMTRNTNEYINISEDWSFEFISRE